MTVELASTEIVEQVASVTGTEIPWGAFSTDSTTVIRLEGKPVAVFGCPSLWAGFGQAWGMVDFSAVEGHGIWFIKEVRRVLNFACDKFGHRQVRALCFAYDHVRFAQLVGFELEGLWADAGPTFQDVFIMVYHRRH